MFVHGYRCKGTEKSNLSTMRRFGSHAEFRRLKGIPKKEAALIRQGRDAIETNLEAYRQALAEVFADDE